MHAIKRGLVGALAFAVSGGALFLGAGAAAAATVPPWETPTDPNSNGTLSFYDSSGHQITGGTNLNHLFDYALGSTAEARTGANKATVFFALPDHTKSDTSTWSAFGASAAATYPDATAPAPLNAATNPLAHPGPSDVNLNSLLGTATLDSTAGYANIIQVRVETSGAGLGNGIDGTYWVADISYDKTAGTWSQVFPAPPASTSVSTITANPASPAPSSTTSVALSATLSAADGTHPGGTVELFNGSTDVGPATLNAATGAISASAPVTTNGSYTFTFVYTSTASGYLGSSSPVLAYSVQGPAATTSTVLSGPNSTTYGTAVTIHADVKTPNATGTAVPVGAGSVQFSINGNPSGSPVPVTATGADFSYNPPGAGTQTITGTFTPAAGKNYAGSSDTTGVTVVTSAPQFAPDPQTVTVTVPSGTLTISTPYTPSNPFNLGSMALDANGTGLSASAPFGSAAKPGDGVTITDTRPGSTGWAASAQTTDFTGPSGTTTPIPGDNLSFTGVTPQYVTGNALQTGMVNTHDITAFKTAKKSFADTTHGPGTVNITGTMGLTAATSTQPGLYTATVTFTIA